MSLRAFLPKKRLNVCSLQAEWLPALCASSSARKTTLQACHSNHGNTNLQDFTILLMGFTTDRRRDRAESVRDRTDRSVGEGAVFLNPQANMTLGAARRKERLVDCSLQAERRPLLEYKLLCTASCLRTFLQRESARTAHDCVLGHSHNSVHSTPRRTFQTVTSGMRWPPLMSGFTRRSLQTRPHLNFMTVCERSLRIDLGSRGPTQHGNLVEIRRKDGAIKGRARRHCQTINSTVAH